MADTRVSTGDVLKLLAEFVKEFNQANAKSASVMNDLMQNGVKFACGDGDKLKGVAGETRAGAGAQADGQKWSAWVGIGLSGLAIGLAAAGGVFAGQELKELQGMRNAGVKDAFEKEAANGGVFGELKPLEEQMDSVGTNPLLGDGEPIELETFIADDIENMSDEGFDLVIGVTNPSEETNEASKIAENQPPKELDERTTVERIGDKESLYTSEADKQQELETIRKKYASGFRGAAKDYSALINSSANSAAQLVQSPYTIKKGAHDAASQADQALGQVQNQGTNYAADFNKGAVNEVASTAAMSDKAMQTVIRSAERA